MTNPIAVSQRARECLATAYEQAGHRDEAAAFRAGDWTCHDHPALVAMMRFEAEIRADERERAAKETQSVWRCAIGDAVASLDCLKNYWLGSRKKAEREAGEVLNIVASILWAARSPASGCYQEAADNGKRMIELVKVNLPAIRNQRDHDHE